MTMRTLLALKGAAFLLSIVTLSHSEPLSCFPCEILHRYDAARCPRSKLDCGTCLDGFVEIECLNGDTECQRYETDDDDNDDDDAELATETTTNGANQQGANFSPKVFGIVFASFAVVTVFLIAACCFVDKRRRSNTPERLSMLKNPFVEGPFMLGAAPPGQAVYEGQVVVVNNGANAPNTEGERTEAADNAVNEQQPLVLRSALS